MTNVSDFGAAGDGKRDDTDAIQHAIADGDAAVLFPPGDYSISKTIEVDLSKTGRLAVFGSGGTAKIIMTASGPALRIVGNHAGTADPGSMKPDIWRRQRMPMIAEIEIEGAHQEADGIELVGCVQPILRNVGLHRLRHGVHLTKRNRNVLIEGCQIYHNIGAGIFFDGVNLHQINIIGNHISYNRLGGIRIERSEVRNLQITGNDIEYNTDRTHKIGIEPTAEIYIDATAQGATVNEATIASNTIQARPSKGGANLRIIEDGKQKDRPPGLYAITGNVIGSQTNNVHLTGCYGITLTGNNIYSAAEHNLLLDGNCRQIVVGSNQFRRHTPNMETGIRITECNDCVISGCHVLDEAEGGQASGRPLLAIDRSQRITVGASQLLATGTTALQIHESNDVIVTGCTISTAATDRDRRTIHWTGEGSGNLVSACRLAGSAPAHVEDAEVRFESNVESVE